MMPFENYEDFCKAFDSDNESKARAELLLFMQDWIIRLTTEDEESIPISVLLETNSDKSSMREAKLDGLSKIVSECDLATRHIADNMRENIIRENVKLPVYQVKEVNSYGLNWLSRRPGRTIKEKISNSTSIMAVRRRMSLDTGENRLFIAFLRELNDILEIKHKYLSSTHITEVEKEYWTFINSVLYKEEIDEIGQWENMPPNNTLLSDQYYKKIWKGWEALKSLDRQIEDDNKFVSKRLCVIVYIEFLSKARGFFRIPQVPVRVDYDDFDLIIESQLFYLIDNQNNKLIISKDKSKIRFEYKNKQLNVTFDDDNVSIETSSSDVTTFKVSPSKIFKIIDLMFVMLGISIKNIVPKQKLLRRNYQRVTIDLFHLHPAYLCKSERIEYLQGNLALQQFGRLNLPCDDTNALIIQTDSMVPYSIQSAIINNSLYQLGQLMHLLEEQIVTNDFTYVFPDAFDEFQLSLLHKAARMAYRKVRAFPRSIGIAFDYQTDSKLSESFEKGDFLLVVDIVDDDVVFTLVQGLVSEDVIREYPDYKGYVWERHPSMSYSIESELNELYDELKTTGFNKYSDKIFESFGIEGVIEANDRLSIIFDNLSWFSFDEKIATLAEKLKVNISDKINKFLYDHREIISSNKVHIVSLSDNIIYKGTCSFIYIERERALIGFRKYEEYQKNTKILLWRDHLPELAIKLLYGKFMLVDNETITPEFNVKKRIHIDNDFTLPANGKTEYRFNLVQSDSNKKTRFMAVVRSSAFPLTEDTLCSLDMTYEYGAENPYVLFFRPKNCKNQKFVEGKVTWEKISEYPMYNLPFPQFSDGKTWDELENYEGKQGIEDLIYDRRGIINSFESIQEGYLTVDLSKYDIKLRNGKNGQTFNIEAQTQDGDPLTVIFSEKNVERNKSNIPSFSFKEYKRGKLSFNLSEPIPSSKRYYVDLSDYADYYGNIWKVMNRGYACFIEIQADEFDSDNPITVALFENQFDHPEQFSTDITHVSFEIQPPYQGKYRAVKIHDEDSAVPYAEPLICWANSIRKGDKPGFFTYSGRIYFLMHTVFSGTNSVFSEDCPEELRQAFQGTIKPWVEEYNRCDNGFVKSRIFGLMSIVGPEIGDDYFAIAHENLNRYMSDDSFLLNDYIGYGLGDYTLSDEVELFIDIQRLPDEKILRILSKAVWGNPNFLWNFPINLTMKYLEKAIDWIGELLKEVNKRKVGKDITLCLEYILAVYRLRERYGDNQSVMKILSQNTKKIRLLYEYVEEIVDMVRDGKITIKCKLALEFTDKGMFNDIPNLLYALLICITGNSKANDIMIAGLSMDDLEV